MILRHLAGKKQDPTTGITCFYSYQGKLPMYCPFISFFTTHIGFNLELHRSQNVVSANCFRYSGFYKGVQSAGAAVAWQIDVHSVSYLHQLIIN